MQELKSLEAELNRQLSSVRGKITSFENAERDKRLDNLKPWVIDALDQNRWISEDEADNEILECLAQIWNKFVKIVPTHPDDTPDFRRAIHQCQAIIAMRKMRRIDPGTWVTYSEFYSPH